MEISVDKVRELAGKHFETVRGFRRHLHAHPELSFEEHETSRYIADFLKEQGIKYTDGWAGGTGVVGEVGKGDSCIALRADIDALPILEINEVSYKSTNEGIMHACGHDVHTASLMGAALILNELSDRLKHRIRLLFQPGEERLPGGASIMIREGALDGVDLILGQHVHPALSVGSFGVCKGYFMASADEIFITVQGKGGHAARPQDVRDPVLGAAAIIQALQSLVSRRNDPMTPSVLSIGRIQSDGGATNIIPDRVHLDGTFRTFDESWRDAAHEAIKRIAMETARSHDVIAEVEIKKGYPALFNDHALTAQVSKNIELYAGHEQTVHLPPRMTAEDFAYYSHKIPACFYRLGTGMAGRKELPAVHTPDFDIDEEALKHSIGMMSWLALNSSLS